MRRVSADFDLIMQIKWYWRLDNILNSCGVPTQVKLEVRSKVRHAIWDEVGLHREVYQSAEGAEDA